MNDTPTPRTDSEQIKGNIENQAATNQEWPWSAINRGYEFSRKLERELSIVTEHRDRLAEALNKYREALSDGPENCSYKMYESVDEFAEKALQFLTPKKETL